MAYTKSTAPAAPVVGGDAQPIDMVLYCPACGLLHVDAPDERTPDWTNPPHKSHLCHGCGNIWRPADVPTNGVTATKTKGSKDTWLSHATPPRLTIDEERVERGAEAWFNERARRCKWSVKWSDLPTNSSERSELRHMMLAALEASFPELVPASEPKEQET